MSLESLIEILKTDLPQYEYRIGKRIYGKCIIARNNNYSGADIFYKKEQYVVEASIPGMGTRLLLGSGALYLKKFRKDYDEPAENIMAFLKSRDLNARLKT